MNSNQKGFTLIELMFAVGIVGILAAVALPVYFDYSTRAKVSEGFALADRAKFSVSETYLMSGEWKDTNSEYGLSEPNQISGKYVLRVGAVQDTVTITYHNLGRSVPDGSIVVFTVTPSG